MIKRIVGLLAAAAVLAVVVFAILGNDAKSGWCRIGSNDQNCTILVICVS